MENRYNDIFNEVMGIKPQTPTAGSSKPKTYDDIFNEVMAMKDTPSATPQSVQPQSNTPEIAAPEHSYQETIPTSSILGGEQKREGVFAESLGKQMQKEHLSKMSTDPTYRDDYFRGLGFQDAEDYRQKTADRLESVLNAIKSNTPDSRFVDYAVYEHSMPVRPMEETVATRQANKVQEAINTLRSNNFWRGLAEGFDLKDIATLGFAQVGDNVAAINALNKAHRGEQLNETEQALVDAWKLGQQVEGEIALLGGRSLASNIGRGVGESLPFVTEMIATGGAAAAATKGISKAIAKKALKEGAEELLKEGSQQVAKKLTKDRIVSGLQKGGLKLAESAVGSAVRVPLSGGVYKNYTGKRLDQFIADDGEIKKYVTPAWKDALKAGFETFAEYQSEDVGNWIGAPINSLGSRFAHSGFGKMLRLDQIADYKGNAGIEWLRDQAKITNLVGETLGEAYGDALINTFEKDKDGWRQMLTKEYWWQLAGVSSILPLATSIPNVLSSGQIDYSRRVAELEKIKTNALTAIKNSDLRTQLTKAAAAPTIAQRSEILKAINWKDTAISKADGFNAVKYINATTAFDISEGEASETERLARFFPVATYLEERAYMGKDGKEATNDIIEIADNKGNAYTVQSGDIDSKDPKTVLKAQDLQGRVWDIPMSDVASIERRSIEDAVSVSYAMMFGTQAKQQSLDKLQSKISDAVAVGVSNEEVKTILENNGVTVYQPGDAVQTVNGESGTIVALDGDHYIVEVTDENGETAVRGYGINDIVQPEMTAADVAMQKAEPNAEVAATTQPAVEPIPTPEQQAIEGVIVEAERAIDEQIDNATNVADGNVYNCILEDDSEVVIRNGNIVLTENGEIDAAKSDSTIVVEYPDGRKQTISPQRIAYIASAENAQQTKENAHEQLRNIVTEQERLSNINMAINNGDPVVTADGRQGVVSATKDGALTLTDTEGNISAITFEDIADVAAPTEEVAEVAPEVVAESTAEQKNNPLIGRSLTEEEATSVIARMQENAAPAVELELTPENWIAEFGESGMVDTPLGEVKMGDNQFLKLAQKGRDGKLGLIKPTLQSPDVIIEESSIAKKGQKTERDSSYVFVKSFANADGTRNYLFTSVTILKDGREVVISNQEKETPRIKRLLKEGKLAYISTATLPSEFAASAQGDQITRPSEAVSLEDASVDGSTTISPAMDAAGRHREISALDATSENKDTTSDSEIQIPRLKNGEVDYNSMSPEMFTEYFLEQFGEQALVKLARNNIKSVDKTIGDVSKKIENLVDPNKMASLSTQLENAILLRQRYERVLDLIGASEIEESDTDRSARLKQEATPRIAQLFPDGLPNAESVVLADIATGKKIRWFDLERNGSVVSRGLGAELGLSNSTKERNRRFGLLSNNAPTPEQYAEELPERLNAMGIRYDESALRDIVLDVYSSVDTRSNAWEVLEQMAQDTASGVPMDYEAAQMKANYEREQRELNGTPEVAPISEEPSSAAIGEAELSTEETVPFSLKEGAGLVTDNFTATLPEQEVSFIDALARALGVKVEFVDVIPGADANAAIFGDKVLIRKKDRTKAVKFLVGHEFTHRMQDLSPEAYADYKGAVKAYMGKRFDTVAARLIRAYEAQKLPYTMDLIEDEVVADFAGEIALKTTVFDNFLKANAENKTLWQVILDVLRSIRDSFAGLFSSKQEQALLHAINKLEDLLEVSSAKVSATNQIKSATDNFDTFDVNRYNIKSAPVFYSNAENAVRNIKQEKATPEQWLKMIEKNGGLKAGEDKWLGLSDWLKASDKKTLTKDEVMEYINQNQIQIEEVKYSEFGPGLIDEAANKLTRELQEIGIDGLREKYPDFDDYFEVDGNEVLWSENTASEGEYEDYIITNQILNVNPKDNAINERRLSYTTAGLRNKQEIALVTPNIESWEASDEVHFGDAGEGRAVAWVRFGDTTDVGGNRVLVIDEIQSKRHQDARDMGYAGVDNLTAEQQPNGIWHIYKDGVFVSPVAKWAGDTPEKAIRQYERMNRVPAAPFEKNWAELAMKRMLRYAAENGYDKVAWTTGDQQAERYNLGAVMTGLKAYKTYSGEYYVMPYNNGAIGEFTKEYTEKELADTFGKELATNIITNAENATEENPYEIEGENLRFGGSGMKTFYDTMLVNFMNKYGKKWGVKVGEVTMPELEENNTMHSVDVTDAMRESVMQGQPLFSIKDVPSLVGIHNLSLEKLRKVIKMGGSLANPSVAVVDIDKSDHSDYGDYSLILPKHLVDSRLGRNAGTWAGDAWTPTYPSVVKKIKKSADITRFYKDINKMPSPISSKVALDFNSYLENRSANALYYWYLFDKGDAPELRMVPSKYSAEIKDALNDITNGSFSLYGLTPEQRAKCVDVYIAQYYGGDRAAYERDLQSQLERIQKFLDHKSGLVARKAKEDLESIKEYGFDYDKIAAFVRDVEYDVRHSGQVDVDATIRAAQEQVQQSNLEGDFNSWKESLDSKYGIEEFIFDGYTPSGNQKWLPHTTANASKWMKKQGRVAATGTFPSFGMFIATVIPRMTSLESIRKRKKQLGNSQEVYDAFREKWEDTYYNLGKKLQPEANTFDDYGWWRLMEAATKSDPQKYIKDQYNIDFSDEDMTTLNTLLDAIKKEYPAKYFETKFERPVALREFAAAVVPDTIPVPVEEYLRLSDLAIYKYDKSVEGSQREATLKAVDSPNIRFSIKSVDPKIAEERERIEREAKSNGTWLKAPNGADTNLTPEQWVTVRTKAFKKWFGDWEKAARIEKLRNSESVSIFGDEITASDDMKEYRKNALEYGKSLRGEYRNADTGNAIIINKDSLTEVLHHDGNNIAHIQSIAAIPQMVESGIYIDSEPISENASRKLRNAKMAHYYVCGLNIADMPYTVKFVVAELESGDRYYDHSLTEIEKGELLNRAEVSSTVAESKSPVSDIKDKRIISILQTNSSKVVDENGEPKVVYNGSKVQHYQYDGRLRTAGQSATNSKVSFFTDNKSVAERYGAFVNEVFLNIRNPYEIDYAGAGWQGWSGAEDGMQRMSTDSYADLLANGTYGSTLGAIIKGYGRAEADHLATGKVFKEGIEPDGVIAYNVADPMRSTLYIVRNAEAKELSRESVTPKGVETFTKLGKSSLLFDSQIKSATDNIGTFDAANDDIRFSIAEQPIDRILDQKRSEFAELQAEYEQLLQNRDNNPNFESALNEWRDRKVKVLQDYLYAFAEDLGIDQYVVIDIFNTRGVREEYSPIVDLWMPGISEEERQKALDTLSNPDTVGIFAPQNGVLIDVSHSDDSELKVYEETIVHEFSHYDDYHKKSDEDLFNLYVENEELIKKFKDLSPYIERGDSEEVLATELLSAAMGRIYRRGAFTALVNGSITPEEAVDVLKYSKPLMREFLIAKLNRYKDYAEQAAERRRTTEASYVYSNQSGWNDERGVYISDGAGRRSTVEDEEFVEVDIQDLIDRGEEFEILVPENARFSIKSEGERAAIETSAIEATDRARTMWAELEAMQLPREEIAKRVKEATGVERTKNGWKYILPENRKKSSWWDNVAPIDVVAADFEHQINRAPQIVDDSLTEEELGIISDAKANGTWLKAPNGAASNLPERQWVTVRTKAFKEWAGDWENDPENSTKFLDANGEPILEYFQAPNEFVVFAGDDQLSGGVFGQGVYTTPYASHYRYGKRKTPLFLNARNPLRLEYNKDEKVFYYQDNKWDNSSSQEIVTWAKSNGFDAVVYQNGNFVTNVVFSADQMTSAHGESILNLAALRIQDMSNKISKLYSKLRDSKDVAHEVAMDIKNTISKELIDIIGKQDFNKLITILDGSVGSRDKAVAVRQLNERVAAISGKALLKNFNKLMGINLEKLNPRGISMIRWIDGEGRLTIKTFKDAIANGITAEQLREEFMKEWKGGEGENFRNPNSIFAAITMKERYEEYQSKVVDIENIETRISNLREKNSKLFQEAKQLDYDKAKRHRIKIARNKRTIDALLAQKVKIENERNLALLYLNSAFEKIMRNGRLAMAERKMQEAIHDYNIIKTAMKDCYDESNPTRGRDDKLSEGKKILLGAHGVLFNPAYSMNTTLRVISVNVPGGEGRFYHYFADRYLKAQADFYAGYNSALKEYTDKAKAIFGKDYAKVLKDSAADSDIIITRIKEGSDEEEENQLTYGEAMYLYMVNKMIDGQVKIRSMGISEENMNKLTESLPAQYRYFADWIQAEFLPKLREKYNQTYIKKFGISMAEIDNYCPLKIQTSENYQEFDGSGADGTYLPTAMTGSVIARKNNTKPIDVNSNALEVIRQHFEDMEHWDAYTFVVSDMNVLLSNTAFRRMLDQQHPGMHDRLKVLSQIAAGKYRSEASEIEIAYGKLNSVVATSKISFRQFTALKQLLSYPAFMSYSANLKFLGKLAIQPLHAKENFKWALENSEIFKARWESRSAGNEKLANVSALEWSKLVQGTAKAGMFSNASIDALVCATGAKAIYDFELESLIKGGMPEEKAHSIALNKAVFALNETQQSSEPLFLSKIQVGKEIGRVALSTFMNSNFSYLRKCVEAIVQLSKRNRDAQIANRIDYYKSQGTFTDEEIAKLAEKDVKKANRKALRDLFIFNHMLNVLWEFGGYIFLYAGGDDDDRDEIHRMMWISALLAPIRNLPLGNLIANLVYGFNTAPMALNELQETIKRIRSWWNEEPEAYNETAFYIALQTASTFGIGVDLVTFDNIYQGVAGMFRDGVHVEDIMNFLNAPQSQSKLLAGKPKEGESLEEYQKRMAFIYKRTNDPTKKDLARWEREYIAGQQRKLLLENGYSSVDMEKSNKRYNEIRKVMGITRSGNLNEDARYEFKHHDPEEQELIRELLRNTRIINAKQKQLERMVDFNDSYLQLMLDIEDLRKEVIEKYDKSNK